MVKIFRSLKYESMVYIILMRMCYGESRACSNNNNKIIVKEVVGVDNYWY